MMARPSATVGVPVDTSSTVADKGAGPMGEPTPGSVGSPESDAGALVAPASLLPTCRYCGRSIAWYVRSSSWRHVTRGVDHAPLPARVAEIR